MSASSTPRGPRGPLELLRQSWRAPRLAPVPPGPLPAGRVVEVPDVGELFVRDSGGQGPPVLLLHGWLFPSDLNWWRTYEPLKRAGYRVLAVDHRGHGRGLRAQAPFRLADCAGDCAALVKTLECGPVIAVGYSMGGPVAQLMARNHADVVAGIVCCATAREWRDPNQRLFWRGMGLFRLYLTVFPRSAWRWRLLRLGYPDDQTTSWIVAELSRGNGRDLAEAGRDLGRYDARPWAENLRTPAAVVVTARDGTVPPVKQRELAATLNAARFEVECDHFCVTSNPEIFHPALLDALEAVRETGSQPTVVDASESAPEAGALATAAGRTPPPSP